MAALLALMAGLLPERGRADAPEARTRAVETAAALGPGYRFRAEYASGTLGRGGKQVIQMTLVRGTRYVLVAGGDAGARDIDLLIYDEQFRLVTRDTDVQSVAVVRVDPPSSGTYHAVIHMVSIKGRKAHWALVTGYR